MEDGNIHLFSQFQGFHKRRDETRADEDAYTNINSNLQTSHEATLTET